MDKRIATYSFDSIVSDTENIAKYITELCNKEEPSILRSVVTVNERVVFVFAALPEKHPRQRYILSVCDIEDDRDFIELVNSRWQGGYQTVGLLKLEKIYMGVFEIDY